MAEIPMGAQDVLTTDSRDAARTTNWAGAIVSIALVAGTCVWGYKILARDVSGVPVVRALEGPMRIKPETPGGRQVENQGLAVNTVAADGAAAKPADRLTLAPPPISLTENDAAITPTSLPVVVEEVLVAEPAPVTGRAAPIVAPAPLDAEGSLTVEQLAAELAAGAKPLRKGAQVEAAMVRPVADETPQVMPEKNRVIGGLKRSLRPVPRPAGLAVRSDARGNDVTLASASAPAIDAAPKVTDAADIPAGTRLVQLGAYASPEIAAAEWDKLTTRFGDYLGDKDRVIQQATSSGKVFYRLRAMGFSDVSDARRLCSALKAENADCIPVTTR